MSSKGDPFAEITNDYRTSDLSFGPFYERNQIEKLLFNIGH